MRVEDQLSQHTQTGQVPAAVGGLQPDEFVKYVNETRAQPMFRATMDKACDYADGNQLSAEVLTTLDKMGFSQLTTNLIKPTIDAVLGIEAKNRTDARVAADDDRHQEVAEALSAKLAEAERESRADRACSDAYSGQVKAGLAWVGVGRNPDPFAYPYRVESVHRREMFWDWSAPVSDTALETARYVIRQKWYPLDQVVAALPQHAQLLRASAGGWQADWMQQASESVALLNALEQENRISISSWDWRNIDAARVALQECWYASHIRGLVLDLGSKVVEFNAKNPIHMAAVQSGQFKPQPAVYRKLRSSIWYGPHQLQDKDPGKTKLPYVPFWGFREDLTGVPYGLVRGMMPLQDEVNARRRKLMWLLSSKRVTVDSDALDHTYNDFAQLVDEVSRPDALIVTNPGRIRADAVRVESDLGLSQQQLEVLTEAKQGIQDVAGIYNSVLGKKDTGADSGIAINSLVEQSSNTLGELNDNFKFSRQTVMSRLLDLIREDLTGKQVTVMAGPNEAKRKIISLNTPMVDSVTGVTYHENDVERADVKVALEEIPTTPAYRAQAQMQLAQASRSLPPQAQAVMIPYIIEAGDLPKRHEIATALRRAMNLPDPDADQEDPRVTALQQQLQQVQQSAEQTASQYEQAVQEQAQATKAANDALAAAQLQLKNRESELVLRGKEVELKSVELSNATEERRLALARQEHDLRLRQDAQALDREKLAVSAAGQSADHQHRTTIAEHAQLLAARTAEQAKADAAQKASQDQAAAAQAKAQADAQADAQAADADDGQDEAKVAQMIADAMNPIAQKLDAVLQAVKTDNDQSAPNATLAAAIEQPTPIASPVASPRATKRHKITIHRNAAGDMEGFSIDGAATQLAQPQTDS